MSGVEWSTRHGNAWLVSKQCYDLDTSTYFISSRLITLHVPDILMTHIYDS